jgi:hypothetical protein
VKNFAGGEFYYTMLVALFGSTDEVVDLLTSASSGNRAAAGEYLAFRGDIPEIIARVRGRGPGFDLIVTGVLEEVAKDRAALDQMVTESPDWAVDWRVALMGPMQPPFNGFQLAALKMVIARKSIGIERPFSEAMLEFPAWQ